IWNKNVGDRMQILSPLFLVNAISCCIISSSMQPEPMSLSQLSLEQFLDELASPSPAPGGGSAAAYAGGLGAALVAMVARLTIGRKNYLDVSPQFEAILPRAEELRHELFELLGQDADAY